MDKKEDILYQKIMKKVHHTDQRQPLSRYLKMWLSFFWELFISCFSMQMRVAACMVFILGIIIGYFYYGNNVTSIDILYNSDSYVEVLDGGE